MCDRLGIDPEALVPEVSLVDELAADSLDLVELALAAEAEFGVVLPDPAVDEVRTYGDLLDAVCVCLPSRRRPAESLDPGLVRARVVPPGEVAGGGLARAGRLTPYVVQAIAEDALHAGRGARVEIEVPTATSDEVLAAVLDRFARLEERGVEIAIRRQRVASARGGEPAPSSPARGGLGV